MRGAPLALVALAAAAAAAATAVPSRADGGAPAAGTTTTTATTTAAATTTTTAAVAPATPVVKKRTRWAARAESVFPAAGQLLVRAVPVRRLPNPRASVIRTMRQFRPDYRIQEIFAVAVRTGANGRPWYRISIPMRPNGTYGWIPASTVRLAPTVSQIVVHRGSRTIDVYRNGKLALHAIVAVGAPGMETPLGHFYVAARFVPYHDPFLGVFGLETSAYSKLSEWPGGGVVGIHGTDMPQLLGQAVSHGCVRVSNQTAAALRKLVPVGTPITITD